MTDIQVLYANIASNIVALLILGVSWRWRNVGRFLFFALFLWAAQINLRNALGNPQVYLDYARWAVAPYREFILGAFSRHITLFVATIALGQLTVAVLVALRGRAVFFGLAGAIAFLLAIAPLGRGAAFPFSLTTSIAAALLWRRRYDRTLIGEVAARIRRRR
ncbi:MAG TPA: hypothetical protein VFH68_24965 [Polyangia bacterium]|nr:hypothetical protein [Polyangia bacterium]